MRPVSPHPHVECVVQKQIGQQGADDGLNAKDNFEFERVAPYRRQREVQRG